MTFSSSYVPSLVAVVVLMVLVLTAQKHRWHHSIKQMEHAALSSFQSIGTGQK